MKCLSAGIYYFWYVLFSQIGNSEPGAHLGFLVGGSAVGGDANQRHKHFSVKIEVKMKELGPSGGVGGANDFS